MTFIGKFLNSKLVKTDTGEETYLSWKEALSYAAGKGGQGMGTSMMNTGINYFMANIMGISATVAGNIRLWCGLWDAINDPILGFLIDKTRSKHGKMRPYIKYAPYFSALTILMFFCGQFVPPAIKIIYIVIAFVGWDMTYTAVDVPIGALAFAITPNGIERTKLYGISSIVRAISGAIPGSFVSLALIVPYFKSNTGSAYVIASSMSAIGMILLTRFTFYNTRERTVYKEETPSLKDSLKLVAKNKPMLLLVISSLMYTIVTIPATVRMFLAVDLMGDSKFNVFLEIATAPAPFLAGLLVPMIAQFFGKKMDFKKFYLGCCGTAGIIHLLFFIVCKGALLNKPSTQAISIPYLIVIMLFVASSLIPLEFKNLCQKEMEAETVDYIEWKTGERSEGIMMSLMSFTGKFQNSVASAISLFLLGYSGYVQHKDAIPVAQSPKASFTLFTMFTLVPLAGYILMAIPVLFYKITGDSHRKMLDEIRQRRAEQGLTYKDNKAHNEESK